MPKHTSMPVTEYLTQLFDSCPMTRAELAKKMGVSRQTLSLITSGKQQISRKMAAALSREFGQTTDFWMRDTVVIEGKEPKRARADLKTVDAQASGPTDPDTGSTIMVDHMVLLAIMNSHIAIDRFDESKLSAASYDLTIGDNVTVFDRENATEEMVNLVENDLTLMPFDTIKIVTNEKVSLSSSYLGRCGALAEHAQKGLFVSHGIQIDPGFSGKLEFSASYLGATSFTVFRGMPILSVEFAKLNTPPKRSYLDFQLDGASDLKERFTDALIDRLSSSPKSYVLDQTDDFDTRYHSHDPEDTASGDLKASSVEALVLNALADDVPLDLVNVINAAAYSVILEEVDVNWLLRRTEDSNTTDRNVVRIQSLNLAERTIIRDLIGQTLFSFAQRLNLSLLRLVQAIFTEKQLRR